MADKAGKIYIVGAGPGDPELITLKAKKLLEKADLVIYAGSLVNEEILKFAEKAEKINSYGKKLSELVEAIEKAVSEGKLVVRLSTGDPCIYSSLKELREELKKRGIEVEVVPGVSAFSAAAAAIKEELTVPNGPQSVVITRIPGNTPVPESEDLARFLSTGASIALFLSADREKAKTIRKKAEKAGVSLNTPVYVIYKASWKDQKIIETNIENLENIDLKNPAVILILPGKKLYGKRSFLYSGKKEESEPSFTIAFTNSTKPAAEKLKELFPLSRLSEGKNTTQRLENSWEKGEPIVFVGALGVLVRKLKVLADSKLSDPPVVAVDAAFNFAIPVLGGHKGANKLARIIAQRLSAIAVVTTATDALGKICLEEILEERGLELAGGSTLEFNSRILKGKPIFSVGLGFHEGEKSESFKGIVKKITDMIGDTPAVFVAPKRRRETAVNSLLPVIPKGTCLLLADEALLKRFPHLSESKASELFGTPIAEPAALSALPEGELVIKKTVFQNITFAVARWIPDG